MLDKRRKYKRIVTVIILLVLVGVGLSGLQIRSVGRYRQEQKQLAQDLFVDESPDVAVQPENTAQAGADDGQEVPGDAFGENDAGQTDRVTPPLGGVEKGKRKPNASPKQSAKAVSTEKPAKQAGKKKHSTKIASTAGKTAKPSKKKASPQKTPTAAPSSDTDGSFVCTITIRCDNLLRYWDDLNESVKKKVPKDGLILPETSVRMTSSDTAHSILQKVCKAKDIALDAEYGNVFSSWYVRGIHHLYEKDAGDTSGWLYRVNGKQPELGASRYYLHAGDAVEWYYSCREEL